VNLQHLSPEILVIIFLFDKRRSCVCLHVHVCVCHNSVRVCLTYISGRQLCGTKTWLLSGAVCPDTGHR